MRTSKRHHKCIAAEEGCRAARRAVEEQRRRRFPVADPALRRMYPSG